MKPQCARSSRGPSLQAVWVLVATVCLALATPSRAQEFRAAWADVFHYGMRNSGQVDAMLSSLATAHYNVLIVQVLGYMDAPSGTLSHGAYWRSNILPRSPFVTSSFDPLAYVCARAHAQGIQVHAWLGGSGGGPYRVSTEWPTPTNPTLTNHPEWFMVPRANSEGRAVVAIDGSYVLDMGSPEVQEYLVSIVRELVTNYPIDGINWDDEINGTGYTEGYGFPAFPQSDYARSGLARYRLNTGYVGTPSVTDAAYSDYRRRFKNELMARMQAEIQSIKTNPRQPLWHTIAPLAYDGPPASCDFKVLPPYTYYCDWAGMLQHGWVDAAIPQVYRTVSGQWSSFTSWCNYSYSCWRYNRQIFIGIGGYRNPAADNLTELQYIYNKGFDGAATYNYWQPTSDSSEWWNFIAANLYTSPVAVPTMPWRNPATATEGLMWGRVKDYITGLYVDDATVSVSGCPSVKTDGNGYYVATLVPATAGGTVHSATASKAGAVSQTIANATVLAGDVVRYDFTLNNSTSPVADIILDNPDAAVSFSGTWQSGSSSSDRYGADYRFASVVAGGTSNVTYRPTILTSGNYDVYIWYPQGSNRATNAPWQVVYNGGGVNVAVNQTVNGGAWRLIAAARPFWAGTSGYVRLSNNSTQAGSVVLADAVRFAFSATQGTPPSLTISPQSLSTNAGANVSFVAAASGNPAPSFQWRFNGTNLSGATASSYSRLGVEPGDAGSYSVVASNIAGLATSPDAVLTVIRPSIDSLQRLATQGFQLQIRGGPGHFAIEATPDLSTWMPLTNLDATEVVFPFLDTDLSQSNRFYRVRGMP